MLDSHQIELSKLAQEVIKDKLKSGEFNSVSEVIDAGMTLLKEHEEKLLILRSAIKEGQNSGYIEDFDWETHRDKLRAEYLDQNG